MARRNRFYGLLLSLLLGSAALPALAQQANFDSLQLAGGFSRSDATVSGNTGGSFSLDRIAAHDSHGQRCMGFGSERPDHIMTLTEDLGAMSLAVHSGGNDTTLIVQGPGNLLLCGDDGHHGQDAHVQASQWPRGTYRVWVGSLQPGERWRYRLTAQQ
ncbi:MAG: hypothetical protein HC910_06720 [Spirulinaceae cyanobacterium SM2_1_0]|nr:hypothetical protein [Spirulinaceae cyanobacterium SM2_1_0]